MCGATCLHCGWLDPRALEEPGGFRRMVIQRVAAVALLAGALIWLAGWSWMRS